MADYTNDRYGRQVRGSGSSFEEGYTAGDNRGRDYRAGQNDRTGRSGQRNPTERSRQSSGYGGRFIDTGDRFMRGMDEEPADIPAQRGRGRAEDSYAGEGRYSDSGGYSQPSGQRARPQAGYDDYDLAEDNRIQRASRGGQDYYDASVRDERTSRGGRDYGDYPTRYERPQAGYDDYDLAEDNRIQRTPRGGQDYYDAPARTQRTARSGRDHDDYPARTQRPSRGGQDSRQYPGGSDSRAYYPVGRGGSRQQGGGLLGWLNRLDSQQMTWLLVGGAVLIVALILALCLVLLSDSCTGCSDCGGSGEIPVIEQGDGDESSFGGSTDFAEPLPDDTTEFVSTSDGMVTIDEELETDSFVVAVTDADGTYGRTDVHRAEAATLVISDQNDTGFAFSLEVKAEGVMGSLSGYAYFCGEREAVYEGAQGLLNFSFGSSGVTVYQVDEISAFEDVTPDGLYITGMPSYIEDEAEQSQSLGLDAGIRNSESVRSTLTGLLSENDLALLDFIFANGTERVFEGSEKGYDMNGTPINIDAELSAVKYYAFISGTGEEVMLICSNDGMVYVGVCDGAQYRYYTNDPGYAASAPKAINGQARGKGMELVYSSAPAEQ